MVEMMKKPYAAAIEQHVTDNPEVICLSADLTSSCEIDHIRDRHPDQFLSLGMAEQNMLSFAAGLAMEGYRPFIHTFGVFLYRRPLDQLICSIAYSNRKVRLMGFLPGIMTPGGITHQAIDDVAIMRAIPNMTILETGDATEVSDCLAIADAIDGPVYTRVWRGLVPKLFDTPMQFNKLRVLGEGNDILVVTAGVCTEEALRVIPALRDAGVSVTHLHASTLKPFDFDTLDHYIAHTGKGIVTLENHLVTGGLGTIVAEHLAETGRGLPLKRLGLQDCYAHGASKEYLMGEYGLDAYALLQSVESLLDDKTGLSREDLTEVRLDDLHSGAKAEAL